MRKFRSTAGGHGSIHQSVANEATDVWRGYAVWSTARTCYRWGQVWQESWSGTDVKRWRGTRVVRFLLSTLLGTCLMCCLLSDCGRPGSTVFNLYRSTWYNSSFVIAHLFDSLTFDVFASCWTVWCLTFCILLNCLMFDWSHVNFFNFVFMRMANVVQARLYHLRIWLDNFNSHPSVCSVPGATWLPGALPCCVTTGAQQHSRAYSSSVKLKEQVRPSRQGIPDQRS